MFGQLELHLRATGIIPGMVGREAEEQGEPTPRYGTPILVKPRLEQAAFRIVVTDAYARRCAVTGERVLPVLEAAHIKPFVEGGPHEVTNGILLRSDLHTLFDRGYMTIAPSYVLEVSKRIREEYENGKAYYALHGTHVRKPANTADKPSESNLAWHNQNKYKG